MEYESEPPARTKAPFRWDVVFQIHHNINEKVFLLYKLIFTRLEYINLISIIMLYLLKSKERKIFAQLCESIKSFSLHLQI